LRQLAGLYPPGAGRNWPGTGDITTSRGRRSQIHLNARLAAFGFKSSTWSCALIVTAAGNSGDLVFLQAGGVADLVQDRKSTNSQTGEFLLLALFREYRIICASIADDSPPECRGTRQIRLQVAEENAFCHRSGPRGRAPPECRTAVGKALFLAAAEDDPNNS